VTTILVTVGVVLLLVGVGIAIGLVARNALTYEPRHTRDSREAKVRADMDALMRVQQLNAAFLAARQGLWDEARRHQNPGHWSAK